jgi:hypothetical protein
MAKQIQAMLNQIIVGRVFMVDVNTSAKLERRAKIYNHHHCLPKSNPGKMMHILVANAHASMVLTLFQYERVNHCLDIAAMSLGLIKSEFFLHPFQDRRKKPIVRTLRHGYAIAYVLGFGDAVLLCKSPECFSIH